MKRCFACLMVCLLSTLNLAVLNAQHKVIAYPEIARPTPGFKLNGINNFGATTAELADFKGKWLVLDFWTKRCSSCIAAFPKINLLQKEFKNSIQFILVGNNEQKYNKGIEALYGDISKVQGLDLVNAYDSTMFERYGVTSTPHIVIIDPDGIVRAITYSNELSAERFRMLLDGKDPGMVLKENRAQLELMQQKMVDPFAVLSNTTHQEGFSATVFSKWNPGNALRINTKLKPGNGYIGAGMSVSRLYNLAYLGQTDWQPGDTLYGRYWPNPVAALSDIITKDQGMKQKQLYNYGLQLTGGQYPLASLKKLMQLDLLKYFGYQVQETESAMPCWLITLADQSKEQLKTKTKVYERKVTHTGVNLTNAPVLDVIHMLWNSKQSTEPIIDATGIDFNIDLMLVADMTSFDSIKDALAKKGINLVRGTHQMKVLVLKD